MDSIEINFADVDVEYIEDEFSSSGTPVKDENACFVCNKKFNTQKECGLHMLVVHKEKICDKDNFKKGISKAQQTTSFQPENKTIVNFRKTFETKEGEGKEEGEGKTKKTIFSGLKKILTPYSSKNVPYQSNLRYRYYLNAPPNNEYKNKSGGFSV